MYQTNYNRQLTNPENRVHAIKSNGSWHEFPSQETASSIALSPHQMQPSYPFGATTKFQIKTKTVIKT